MALRCPDHRLALTTSKPLETTSDNVQSSASTANDGGKILIKDETINRRLRHSRQYATFYSEYVDEWDNAWKALRRNQIIVNCYNISETMFQ